MYLTLEWLRLLLLQQSFVLDKLQFELLDSHICFILLSLTFAPLGIRICFLRMQLPRQSLVFLN